MTWEKDMKRMGKGIDEQQRRHKTVRQRRQEEMKKMNPELCETVYKEITQQRIQGML